jgi:hypothetical protein
MLRIAIVLNVLIASPSGVNEEREVSQTRYMHGTPPIP